MVSMCSVHAHFNKSKAPPSTLKTSVGHETHFATKKKSSSLLMSSKGTHRIINQIKYCSSTKYHFSISATSGGHVVDEGCVLVVKRISLYYSRGQKKEFPLFTTLNI